MVAMIHVRRERTGFRDLAWSLHTRLYGWDAPHLDIDRVLYTRESPVAIVEDRNEHGMLYDKGKSNIKVLSRLGQRFALPTFFHRYASDFRWHTIAPMNQIAKMFPPDRGFNEKLTDTENCVWEYRVRGQTITEVEASRIMAHQRDNSADKPIHDMLLLPRDSCFARKQALARLTAAERIALYADLKEVMAETAT